MTPAATATPDLATPDLTDRQARCVCHALVPSDPKLAFFEFRGDGSRLATISCKHCGLYGVAHDAVYCAKYNRSRSIVEEGRCPGVEARGAFEFDSFYCGCSGWD